MTETDLTTIKNALEKELVKAKKSFAVFDFDNTCIINDIGEAVLAYLCGHELLRDRTLLGTADDSPNYHARVFRTYHHLLREGKRKASAMLCARLFSGFTPGEAEAATLAAITEEGVRIGSKVLFDVHIERGLALRKKTIEVMDFLREKKVTIWIVSASPEPAVRATMHHFGIEGNLRAVRSILDNGIYTSEFEVPTPIGEGKVDVMREFIDAKRSPLAVVDDSTTGLPLLETAKIKVIVDRGKELTDIARERGWFIL